MKYIRPETLAAAKRYVTAKKKGIPNANQVKHYVVGAFFTKTNGAGEVKEFLDALRRAGNNRVSGDFVRTAILNAVREARNPIK
jgi:hypothetical protein